MVKQQKVGLASQQLLWDYGLGLRINCPKNNLNISNNKPQPISAGADSTVYTVSGFLNRYTVCKQSVQFSAPVMTGSFFQGGFRLFSGQCMVTLFLGTVHGDASLRFTNVRYSYRDSFCSLLYFLVHVGKDTFTHMNLLVPTYSIIIHTPPTYYICDITHVAFLCDQLYILYLHCVGVP